MSTNTKGLRERILVAKHPDAIIALLEEGSKYLHASPATKRAWARAAARREAFLKNPPKPVPAEKVNPDGSVQRGDKGKSKKVVNRNARNAKN